MIRLEALLLHLIIGLAAAAQTTIPVGHSHNDYHQPHPLSTAMLYGYKSIEVDVHLYHNQLIVSHDAKGLDHKPSIEQQFLMPLYQRVQENKGKVYQGDSTPLILMIDFKTDGELAYPVLKALIAKYSTLFCDREGNGGAVKLLLSGNSPIATVSKGMEQYVTLDRPIAASYDTCPSYIIERVSDPYAKFFKWKGKGEMPTVEQDQLTTLVKTAHAHGRKIRFYACPPIPAIWQELLDAGVDWINVDKLAKFAAFYQYYSGHKGKPASCHCVRM
jgi:hypothetical protein